MTIPTDADKTLPPVFAHDGCFYYAHRRIARTDEQVRVWMDTKEYWPNV